MARPQKQGLDYFNIVIEPEDKLVFFEAKHGVKGYGTLVKLWRRVYKYNGYWCPWDSKVEIIFAKEISVEVSYLKEIVQTCLEEDIFSKSMYDNYGILTSSGCQKFWKEVVKNAKRLNTEIDPKFDLLATPKKSPHNLHQSGKNDVSPEEMWVSARGNLNTAGFTQEESTQSKVKESKVKESIKELPVKKNSCCCIKNHSDLKQQAAAAIMVYKKDLPDHIVTQIAEDIADKNTNKKIKDWDAMIASFVKNHKPRTSTTNGNGHKKIDIKVRGIKFDNQKTKVLLSNDDWQELTPKQKALVETGALKPEDFYQGKK